jgi:hypothetical protein
VLALQLHHGIEVGCRGRHAARQFVLACAATVAHELFRQRLPQIGLESLRGMASLDDDVDHGGGAVVDHVPAVVEGINDVHIVTRTTEQDVAASAAVQLVITCPG